jgi:hypothetical protein
MFMCITWFLQNYTSHAILCFINVFIFSHLLSSVSRVWQVGHVPWAPLEEGATEGF